MRKYIGKKKTYRISDENYTVFKSWSSKRGVDTSLAIRGAVSLLMEKGNLSELLENENLRNMAVQLLTKN